MRILMEDEYHAEAEPLINQLFVINTTPSDLPTLDVLFKPDITSRRIIYACKPYVESPLIDIVIDTALKLGDQACYLLVNNYCCYFPISEFSIASGWMGYEEFSSFFGSILVGSHLIFSSSGKWGITVDDSGYGLLGGSKEFINRIRSLYPMLDRQVYDFLRYWKEDYEYAGSEHSEMFTCTLKYWLPSLLEHIYGYKMAIELLRNSSLGHLEKFVNILEGTSKNRFVDG